MLDPNNSNRGNFEKHWEDAFEGAELFPSEDVWEKVESNLNKSETKYLRKTIFYYRWAIAASVSLMLLFASYAVFNNLNSEIDKMAMEESEVEKTGNQPVVLNNEEDDLRGKEDKNHLISEAGITNLANDGIQNDRVPKEDREKYSVSKSSFVHSARSITDKVKDELPDVASESSILGNNGNLIKLSINPATAKKTDGAKLASEYNFDLYKSRLESNSIGAGFYSSNNFALKENNSSEEKTNKSIENVIPATKESKVLIAREEKSELKLDMFEEEKKEVKKKGKKSKSFFAGLAMATDVHAGGLGVSATQDRTFLSAGPSSSNDSRGNQSSGSNVVSYAYGVNTGYHLNEKWVIQGGLQYGHYNVNSTSNVVLNNQLKSSSHPYHFAALQNNRSAEDYTIGFTSSFYEMTSNYNFLSLPVKAGYTFGGRKLNMVLSGGMLTDIFINNTISGEDSRLEKLVLSAGSDSPYQNLYFSGLLSTDVNYNILEKYSVSLSPFFRQSINISGEYDLFREMRPNSFGVTFGLKYHF
jgi:hypothetical protein